MKSFLQIVPLAAGLVAASARAQPVLRAPAESYAAVRRAEAARCAPAVPAQALTRVPVVVSAEVVDSADRVARPAVDLIAQEVAREMRALVRGARAPNDSLEAKGQVPAVDSGFAWSATETERVVVVTRSGAVRWRRAAGIPEDTGGVLLERGLEAAQRSGAILVLPDEMRGDSLIFEVTLQHPEVRGPERMLRPMRVRNPAPAFTALVPWEQPVAADPQHPMRGRYPDGAQRTGYQGAIILQFAVDTLGRAEGSTVRDVWPASAQPLNIDERRAYESFVAAAKGTVVNASFTPATVAGCRVRSLVRQPVTYKLTP